MDGDLTIDINIKTEALEKKDDALWDILVDQVIKGNVIPVIGTELTSTNGQTISDILVNNLSSYCNMKTSASNFSQLIPRFRVEHANENIYRFVYGILNKENNTSLTTPSKTLMDLLSIKYFPFVLYTSYDQTVEKAMKQIHGDKLRVYTFDNNADTNDDIPPLDNLKTQTLYYMFGKANNEDRRYVLSDKDILDFSRSWLAETDSTNKAKPANLSNALANKFLLVIGCNYTDWLFRFFWFAMKDVKIKHKNDDEQKIGLLTVGNSTNEELIDFLTRSNTLTQTIPVNEFVAQLCAKISKKEEQLKADNTQVKFERPQENTDVFISYSRADKDIAERLYDSLTREGIDVWYDKKNLGLGSEFWKDIRYAIRTTKLFVPILTNSIKKQYRDEHVYRDEWHEAITRKRRMGNVAYIYPLCLDNFDPYDRESDIPEEILSYNCMTCSKKCNEDELHNIANEIKSELLKIKQDERI